MGDISYDLNLHGPWVVQRRHKKSTLQDGKFSLSMKVKKFYHQFHPNLDNKMPGVYSYTQTNSNAVNTSQRLCIISMHDEISSDFQNNFLQTSVL